MKTGWCVLVLIAAIGQAGASGRVKGPIPKSPSKNSYTINNRKLFIDGHLVSVKDRRKRGRPMKLHEGPVEKIDVSKMQHLEGNIYYNASNDTFYTKVSGEQGRPLMSKQGVDEAYWNIFGRPPAHPESSRTKLNPELEIKVRAAREKILRAYQSDD